MSLNLLRVRKKDSIVPGTRVSKGKEERKEMGGCCPLYIRSLGFEFEACKKQEIGNVGISSLVLGRKGASC